MAHECPLCGMECYCHGDIDDYVVSLPPKNCTCDCELRDLQDDEFYSQITFDHDEQEVADA